MKEKIEGLKKWLTDNKIFFETLMAAALSVAAILVSCSANGILDVQKEIAKESMEIERTSESPSINLSFSYDEQKKYLKTLEVTGIGGRIDQISFKLYPIIRYLLVPEDLIKSKEPSVHGMRYTFVSDFANEGDALFTGQKNNSREGVLYQIKCNDHVYEIVDQVGEYISDGSNSVTIKNEEGILCNLVGFSIHYVLKVSYRAAVEANDETPTSHAESYIISPGFEYLSDSINSNNLMIGIPYTNDEEHYYYPYVNNKDPIDLKVHDDLGIHRFVPILRSLNDPAIKVSGKVNEDVQSFISAVREDMNYRISCIGKEETQIYKLDIYN